MPVRYGAPLNQTAPTAAALRRLAALYAGERYLLSVAPPDAEGDAPRTVTRETQPGAVWFNAARGASAFTGRYE
jgi:hypothetical protein